MRLVDLGDQIPPLAIRIAEPGLVGIQSLAVRRTRPEASSRSPAAPALSEAEQEEPAGDGKNIRNSLRLDRANRFVERPDLLPGDVVSSRSMPIHNRG